MSPADLRQALPLFDEFVGRFAPLLGDDSRPERARAYLRGLLLDNDDTKTAEAIALKVYGDPSQVRLLGLAPATEPTRRPMPRADARTVAAQAIAGYWITHCAVLLIKVGELAMQYDRTRFGIIIVGLLTLAAWSSQGPAQTKPTTDAETTKAVRKVLDDQVAAWNKGDLKGFMAGYWRSPELSFFSGKDTTRGWQATLERYQRRYQAEGKEMGKLTFREVQIDILGPDSAWVRGRWQLVLSKDTVGGLFTLIFKKFPDGWRIVHDHTSS